MLIPMPINQIKSPGLRESHWRTDLRNSFVVILDNSCETAVWAVNFDAWWRHQMETFSALLAICAGNSPVPGEFPAQRPVTRSFDVFFDLRPNKRLCKQPWGWWFETLSWSLWRHRNDSITVVLNLVIEFLSNSEFFCLTPWFSSGFT